MIIELRSHPGTDAFFLDSFDNIAESMKRESYFCRMKSFFVENSQKCIAHILVFRLSVGQNDLWKITMDILNN